MSAARCWRLPRQAMLLALIAPMAALLVFTPHAASAEPAAAPVAQILAFQRQSEPDLAQPANRPPAPDGQPDAVLRLWLHAPGDRLTGLDLRSTSGAPLLVWDTAPASPYWRGAVVVDGAVRNTDNSPLDMPLGRAPVDIAFHFAPAQYFPRLVDGATGFALTLSLASGRALTLEAAPGFERAAPAPLPTALQPDPAPLAPEAAGLVERVFWESIVGRDDPAEFRAYLDRWPDGAFADLARRRLAALGAVASPDAVGWIVYENPRFGTHVRYPAGWFAPEPPPENEDGRRFRAPDGAAGFLVFGQHDVFATTPGLALQEDIDRGGFDRVLRQEITADGYSLTALRGGAVVQRRLRIDAASGLIHVFEGFYPEAQAARLAPVMARIADSLDPGSAPVSRDVPPPPPHEPAAFATPGRDTALRGALIDAARQPVAGELGRPLLFRIETLRTAGDWGYLAGVPLEADGGPFDWQRSPYARSWSADLMSDLVMVLLVRREGQWRALHHVIGPTDVHWIDWMRIYGLPAALFHAP